MKFTIFGSSGFIGKNIVRKLNDKGYEIFAPTSKELEFIDFKKLGNLGYVLYCIGMTANFRQQMYKTIDAHICVLNKILNNSQYQSLTYVSSTRMYYGSIETTEETPITFNQQEYNDLYNISKFMGERLCLASNENNKVVRLSNVYGNDSSESFLSEILASLVDDGHVHFKTAENSSKDYISVSDVVNLLPKIAIHGKEKIYNVASGHNTENIQIANKILELGYSYSFEKKCPIWSFPKINITRISKEFGCRPSNLLDDFESLINGSDF